MIILQFERMLHTLIICPFLLLSRMPSYGYSTIRFFIHLLADFGLFLFAAYFTNTAGVSIRVQIRVRTGAALSLR